MEKNNSPALKIMLTVMLAGLAGCLIFGVLRYKFGYGWAMPIAITCGMFAYHMGIRFFAPGILWCITRKRYDPDSAWFREKPWEKKLYRRLRVKKWKSRAMTFDPREYSLELHTPEEVLNNMCHSELVHEVLAVLSFSSLLFAVPFGAFWVFFITALLAAVYDLSFAIIQRFNRPRVKRLMRKADRCSGGQTV